MDRVFSKNTIYLALALVGLVWPWYFNLQYFTNSDSIHFIPYLRTLMANPATAALTIDVYVTALALSCWVYFESKSLKLRWPFLYMFLCFGIGLSFAAPLFLAVRERCLQKRKSNELELT